MFRLCQPASSALQSQLQVSTGRMCTSALGRASSTSKPSLCCVVTAEVAFQTAVLSQASRSFNKRSRSEARGFAAAQVTCGSQTASIEVKGEWQLPLQRLNGDLLKALRSTDTRDLVLPALQQVVLRLNNMHIDLRHFLCLFHLHNTQVQGGTDPQKINKALHCTAGAV